MAVVTTHDADTVYLMRQSMRAGFQIFSLLTPPLYTTFILMRRGKGAWSFNRFLRASWVGGLTGAGLGGGTAYVRYKYSNADSVHQRRLEVTYDVNRIRAQDHSTIGAVIMAMLTPAILWNRANIVNLILGGASLGSGIGNLTHYARTLTGDPPNQVTVVMVEEK